MSTPDPFDEGGDDASLEIAATPEPAEKPALSVLEGGKQDEKLAEVKAESKPADDYETKYNNLQAALREERAEKARQKEELQAQAARLKEFEQLRDEIKAQRDAKRQQDEAEKLQTDPVAYFKERLDATEAQTRELAERTQRQTAEQEEQSRFLTHVSTQVQAYQKDHPDYNDALQFAYQKRMGEYEVMGIPAEYREQQFVQESLELSRMALNQGRNPAEIVYGLAKQWGFSAKQAEAIKSDAQTQVERLASGQSAAKTLSKPGTSGEESILKRIEDMDDDEFDKFWNTEIKPKRR